MKKLILSCVVLLMFCLGNTTALTPNKETEFNHKQHKTQLELYIEDALMRLRMRNDRIFNTINSPLKIKPFEQFIINNLQNYPFIIRYSEYCPPVDRATIISFYNFILDAFSEITQLAIEVRSIIEDNAMYNYFLEIILYYISLVTNEVIAANLTVQHGTPIDDDKILYEEFSNLRNILKQNQNEETKEFIDQLFSYNNPTINKLTLDAESGIKNAETNKNKKRIDKNLEKFTEEYKERKIKRAQEKMREIENRYKESSEKEGLVIDEFIEGSDS